jgi:hypothetical protein
MAVDVSLSCTPESVSVSLVAFPPLVAVLILFRSDIGMFTFINVSSYSFVAS